MIKPTYAFMAGVVVTLMLASGLYYFTEKSPTADLIETNTGNGTCRVKMMVSDCDQSSTQILDAIYERGYVVGYWTAVNRSTQSTLPKGSV